MLINARAYDKTQDCISQEFHRFVVVQVLSLMLVNERAMSQSLRKQFRVFEAVPQKILQVVRRRSWEWIS